MSPLGSGLTMRGGDLCACGCGRKTRVVTTMDRVRTYVAGHNPQPAGNWGREGVKERAVRMIRAYTAEHGHAPTTAEWANARPVGAPSISTLCNTFGSWKAAKAAAL